MFKRSRRDTNADEELERANCNSVALEILVMLR